ncbi:MAG: hypothetical protein LBN33_04215 [Desulfovibrio sp.]|jgi:hypothetical protein|nr:hypothetical protein [Desulfovibrio sp.]
MSDAQKIEISFALDLDAFLAENGGLDISADLRAALADACKRWQNSLQALHLRVKEDEEGGSAKQFGRTKSKDLLLVRLSDAAEQEAGGDWENAPYRSFLYHSLAQALCMGLARTIIPEIAAHGCAPIPKPTPALAAILAAAGVPYLKPDGPVLSRSFALLTPYPFRGGCAICFLNKDCKVCAALGQNRLSRPETTKGEG